MWALAAGHGVGTRVRTGHRSCRWVRVLEAGQGDEGVHTGAGSGEGAGTRGRTG